MCAPASSFESTISLAFSEIANYVLNDAPSLSRLLPFFLSCGVFISDLSAKFLKVWLVFLQVNTGVMTLSTFFTPHNNRGDYESDKRCKRSYKETKCQYH